MAAGVDARLPQPPLAQTGMCPCVHGLLGEGKLSQFFV